MASWGDWIATNLQKTKEAVVEGSLIAVEHASRAATVIVEESSKVGHVVVEQSGKMGGEAVVLLTKTADTVVTGTKTAVDYVSTATVATYTDLTSVPTEVACSGCGAEVKVPSNVFDWVCINNHTVVGNASVCECGDHKPSSPLSKPTVLCLECNATTVVPETKAHAKLANAPKATQMFLEQTGNQITSTVETLAKPPTVFNCSNCHTELQAPTGPWQCQTCAATNEEDFPMCCTCTQPKSAQQVRCGVCQRLQHIPSSNFTNTFTSSARELGKTSKKALLDLSNQPYITCLFCGSHVSVDGKSSDGSLNCDTCGNPVAGLSNHTEHTDLESTELGASPAASYPGFQGAHGGDAQPSPSASAADEAPVVNLVFHE